LIERQNSVERQSLVERHVVLRDGDRVFIRQLTADDAALYPDFLADVTQDDLRLRFFATMREVSPQLVHQLVHYDARIAMAFIAIEEATGRMLGVVRLHDDPAGRHGEFAILLRSHLKGRGLGWLMMQHVIDYARGKGLKSVRGQVLAENTTMLQMCEELGFAVSDDPNERGIKTVDLPLTAAQAPSP